MNDDLLLARNKTRFATSWGCPSLPRAVFALILSRILSGTADAMGVSMNPGNMHDTRMEEVGGSFDLDRRAISFASERVRPSTPPLLAE